MELYQELYCIVANTTFELQCIISGLGANSGPMSSGQ